MYFFVKLEKSMLEGIEAILLQFTVPDETWLYLNLNDLHVTESPHSERALQVLPFISSAGKRRMTILEMTTAIIEAAHDRRVKGLVIASNPSMIEHRAVITGEVIESHLGMAAISEIQDAVKAFVRIKRLQRMNEDPPIEPNMGIPFSIPELPGLAGQYEPCRDVVIAISDNYCTNTLGRMD